VINNPPGKKKKRESGKPHNIELQNKQILVRLHSINLDRLGKCGGNLEQTNIGKRKIKPKTIPTERTDRFFIVNACFLRRSLSLLERHTDPEGNSFELISLTRVDRSA